MEKRQKIFAVLFIVTLLGFSVYNIVSSHEAIVTDLKEEETPSSIRDVQAYLSTVDSTLTSNLALGYMWNDVYANVYNALSKNEENSFKYVRDKEGWLYAGNFWNTSEVEPKEYALRVKRIQEQVADKDTKVVVLLYPTQYNEEWSDGYSGIPYQDYNEFADELVRYFRYYNIDCIDFKQHYLAEKRQVQDIYYKTDHHWTVQSAFEGFQILTEHLNEEYGENLDSYYTNLDNYIIETHKEVFVGSQGRDAGLNYVGLDDYTFIIPKFETYYDYTYQSTSGLEVHQEGSIDRTLITKGYLERDDYYMRDMYNSYLNGVCKYDHIENLLNEEGLNVLFLRDSYSSPLATFFSSYCSSVDMMWTARTESEVIEGVVASGEYDYIFIGLATDSWVDGGAEFFMEKEEVNE